MAVEESKDDHHGTTGWWSTHVLLESSLECLFLVFFHSVLRAQRYIPILRQCPRPAECSTRTIASSSFVCWEVRLPSRPLLLGTWYPVTVMTLRNRVGAPTSQKIEQRVAKFAARNLTTTQRLKDPTHHDNKGPRIRHLPRSIRTDVPWKKKWPRMVEP